MTDERDTESTAAVAEQATEDTEQATEDTATEETAEEKPSVWWACIQYLAAIAKDVLADETCVVTVGGTTVTRQDEFLVRELPQGVSFTDPVTSTVMGRRANGGWRTEFNVAFELWAKRSTLQGASELVLRWMQAVFAAVGADKTLGGLVVHAEPYFESGGTSVDTNKTYTAGIDCGIRIKAELDPATD